jgi:hypothetical protein
VTFFEFPADSLPPKLIQVSLVTATTMDSGQSVALNNLWVSSTDQMLILCVSQTMFPLQLAIAAVSCRSAGRCKPEHTTTLCIGSCLILEPEFA